MKEIGEVTGYRFDWKGPYARPIRQVRLSNGYEEEQFMEGFFNSEEIWQLINYRARLRSQYHDFKPSITEFIICLN